MHSEKDWQCFCKSGLVQLEKQHDIFPENMTFYIEFLCGADDFPTKVRLII